MSEELVRGFSKRTGQIDVELDRLVRTVTGRTPERDEDRTVSDAVADRVFDRLAGPDG
jgi:hypothetical protein